MGGKTIAITVSYDGARFAGFARQPGLDTVQGRIETALRTVLRCDIEIVGAGRTDAGVHALGQVVSFDVPSDHEVDTHALARSLNALAGPDVVVREVREADPGFSARFDAVSREYRYRIVPGPVPPLFLRDLAWWPKVPLELRAMRRAADALVGEHDFRSFCATESAEGKRTVRHVELVEVLPAEELGEHCVVVRVVGNAFLHSMVRVMVGTLVEVGAGRSEEGWVAEVLSARDRVAAGPTAPAHGLTLWHVDYPDEVWL
ncbi:MAG: tRNA pseudouridine(38-40) synthase TruA [Actinomycetota bacterium]|nr:tRNA pseudouridine(38-40) synthase TruA [Actinomycetota bacterium]